MAVWARFLVLVVLPVGVSGAVLDTIGVVALRQVSPDLIGAGIAVAQPEAGNGGASSWQVNPAAVGQPQSLFTWTSASGTTNQFPNSLGTQSGHANMVGDSIFGLTNGVAPGVDRVDSFEANHFISLIQGQTDIGVRVVNQSFILTGQQPAADQAYDNFAARHNVLFVSGVGNSGPPNSPSTAYNGLSVAAFGGASSVGPTSDGRSKPDITAPASQTSFSTPLVAGAAAVLIQAGTNGVGGVGTAGDVTDIRTLKALLLNGAAKPGNWTNGTTTPLDARFGAGVLNVFDAWRQLRGGQHGAETNLAYTVGASHPPPPGPAGIVARRGWDYATLSSSVAQDRVNHYFFDWSNGSNQTFTLTATLVWNRQLNKSSISDLDLFLYDVGTTSLVAASQSPVDNVEHLHVNGLPPGHYNLQVLKHGGAGALLANPETYALAFDFGPPAEAWIGEASTELGAFQARLFGEPLERYVIECTPDFAGWTPIATNMTEVDGWFDFTNSLAGPSEPRFYRSRLAP